MKKCKSQFIACIDSSALWRYSLWGRSCLKRSGTRRARVIKLQTLLKSVGLRIDGVEWVAGGREERKVAVVINSFEERVSVDD